MADALGIGHFSCVSHCIGRITWRVLALSLAVLALLAAGPAGAEEAPPIPLAVVVPRDLPQHRQGLNLRTAAEATVATINSRGGLLGRRLALEIYDDDCQAETAGTIAHTLTAIPVPRRPVAVIGHPCSGAAIAAAPVYAEAGLLFMAAGARHPRLTDQRRAPLVFRLAPREDRQASDIADLVRIRFAGHRVALVHDRSAEAQRLATGIEAALARHGIRLALREAYKHGETAYDALVQKLARAEATLVIIPAQPVETGIIARRLATAMPEVRLLAGEAMAAPGLDHIVDALGSRLLLMIPWQERPPPRNATTKTPNALEVAPGHSLRVSLVAAIEAWAQAVTRAATLETDAVVRALETEAAQTVAGAIRFDTRGDAVIPSYVAWVWLDDRWQIFD